MESIEVSLSGRMHLVLLLTYRVTALALPRGTIAHRSLIGRNVTNQGLLRVSIRKSRFVSSRGRSCRSAEKRPRGVHHEMRTYVFAASLSSLGRMRADDFANRSAGLRPVSSQLFLKLGNTLSD